MKVTHEISKTVITDLLVSAFEGGSNYWYDNLMPLKRTSKAKEASDRFYEDLTNNGFTLMDSNDGVFHMVTPKDFKTSFRLMAEDYSHHYQDVLLENGDAVTGDVFLQLAVFKKVIYG